jgi:uncharacterized protein
MQTLGLPPQALVEQLVDAFRSRRGVLVAFSGGVDSTVVAKLAQMALGPRALAVTAEAESLASWEREEARRVASEVGIRHLVVRYSELADPNYASNPINRCYFCRTDLARHLKPIAEEEGMEAIASGVLASDLKDYRPGIRAMDEAGFWHPLAEHGLDKPAARALASHLGLSVAGKPSMACLSSRIPYGEAITVEKLTQVDRAEAYLRSLGFPQVRVRHHGPVARIEVSREEVGRLLDPETSAAVARELKALGFTYVAVDLEGYRSGSMNAGPGPKAL